MLAVYDTFCKYFIHKESYIALMDQINECETNLIFVFVPALVQPRRRSL